MKTITMSEGEFDFDTNFALESEGTTKDIAYPNTTFIIWLIFVVLMSLLLQNLLVSFMIQIYAPLLLPFSPSIPTCNLLLSL